MSRRRPPARAVALWGLAGLAIAFVEAIARLGARALDTLQGGLRVEEWFLLVLTVALFVYGEGVRALARRFVPHVVGRAMRAADHPSVWASVLAPLFAMSLVFDTRKAIARAWMGVALIVLAVLAVRLLPHPWRGIIDAGVASALLWGLGSMVVRGGRAVVRGR